MSDGSCSGSSPFKHLVDQQNRDVSHHQDRLTDNSAAGGNLGSFRSQPAHPAQAQNDFGAFMNGNASLPGAPHPPAGRLAAHAAALDHHQSHPVHHQEMIAPAPQAPQANNWAADFARFANGRPQHNVQPFIQQPAVPQQQQLAPPAQLQQGGMAQAFGFNPGMVTMQPNGGFTPLYGPTNGGFMDANMAAAQRPLAEAEFQQEMDRWMSVHSENAGSATAMEDVDAIMEQMARELELNDHAFQEAEAEESTTRFTDLDGPELGNLLLNSGPPAALAEEATTQQEEPKVSDAAEETAQQAAPKPRSEVSEIAEKLLEQVQHEDSEKWKNSAFLSLMRDFRDGKKDIVGNEIRDTEDPAGEQAKETTN